MSGFSGQGKVSIGTRLVSGLPGPMRWLGNASVFKCAQAVETVERKESYSGNRLPFRKMTKSQSGTVNITFDEFSAKNMEWALLAVNNQVAAGSAVVGWVAPTGFVVGDTMLLPSKNVSAVVVKDSTGSPKTLPAGQYTLDAFAGSITLNDITTGGPYVQPFKVDYTPGAVQVLGAFQLVSTEVYVRMDGINTDDGSRVIVDCFRTRLSPSKDMSFINDDYNDFELEGALLADLTRTTGQVGGQFYSLTLP